MVSCGFDVGRLDTELPRLENVDSLYRFYNQPPCPKKESIFWSVAIEVGRNGSTPPRPQSTMLRGLVSFHQRLARKRWTAQHCFSGARGRSRASTNWLFFWTPVSDCNICWWKNLGFGAILTRAFCPKLLGLEIMVIASWNKHRMLQRRKEFCVIMYISMDIHETTRNHHETSHETTRILSTNLRNHLSKKKEVYRTYK